MDNDKEDARELHKKAAMLWRATKSLDQQSARDEAAGRSVAYGVPVVWDGPANWARSLASYEGFWSTSNPNRAPRENTRNRQSLSQEERNHGEWARRQRRYRVRLSAFQVERLNVSPAFRWDPVQSSWADRLQECRIFLDKKGQLPRLSRTDSHEYQMARWLNRQLRQLRDGKLSPARAAALDAFLRHDRDAGH
ncbi:MAG: helicase associated domain-containing protein [Kineosporiaceae bacterium]|nr:helicase associated domain-containing protein [Aeromicrobium sp.]